jgi:beta-galactosidase
MYLPGPWLKRGANEVLILDLGESVPDPSVQGLTNPVLDEVHPG